MENKPTEMKNIPEKIYLHVDSEQVKTNDFSALDPEEVYWSESRQDKRDIEYVLSAQQFQTASHLPEGGEIAFIPCDENDERCVGGFTSSDGQSLCYVREIYLSTYQPNQP